MAGASPDELRTQEEQPAPVVRAMTSLKKCDSCGAPTESEGLCDTCQQAFHAVLDSGALPPPVEDAVEHPVEDPVDNPVENNKDVEPIAVRGQELPSEPPDASSVKKLSEFFATLAEPSVADVAPAEPAAVEPAAGLPLTPAVTTAVTAPPPAPMSGADLIATALAHAKPIGIKSMPVPEPPPVPAPVVEAMRASQPNIEPVVEPLTEVEIEEPKIAAPAPKAAPAQAVPFAAVAAQQPNRMRSIAMGGAALVILAAIGFPLSQRWFNSQQIVVQPAQSQPKPAAVPKPAANPKPPVAEHPPVTAPVTVPVSPVELAVARTPVAPPAVEPATPKVAAVAPSPSKPAVTAAPKAAGQQTVAQNSAKAGTPAAKPTTSAAMLRQQQRARQAAQPPVQAAAAPVVNPAPVTVPVEAPAPPPPAPEPAAPAASTPVAPFFEVRDVNDAPQVASRVEPKVPTDVSRPVKEIVIVRVLVSQAGQPSLVSLLRRSRAGSSLDNAVVAAVKQWTFAPARKKGEPVSCWYHVGVQISAD
jgi:TonB family protein